MEARNKIKISIIVPVYNVINELERCVNSLINQTYDDIEIILVDDGSTDGSEDMCDRYEKESKKIHAYHKANGGLSDARNYGFSYATGDYILFVDSDDYIERKACEKFVQSIGKDYPEMVVSDAVMIKGDKFIQMKHDVLDPTKMYSFEEIISLLIPANQWYAPAWLNLYKRDYLIKCELRFVKGLLHEDMEFLPRVFMKAKKIKYLPYNFYNYVVRPNSIMTSRKKEKNGVALLTIYRGWKEQFVSIKNEKIQKLLNGYLVKNYLHTCREFHILFSNEIFALRKSFIIRNSINSIECLRNIASIVIISMFRKK